MKTLSYRVSFATPAFLGNAKQEAQWRTPPFKALLRQWWRVVKAPRLQQSFNVDLLRKKEAELFGAASDEGDMKSHRSRVRLRLDHWDHGKLTEWPARKLLEFHPEVGDRGRKVGADLYLGFGPLEYDKATMSTQLGTSKSSGARRTAIDERARALLRLMLPEQNCLDVQQAMQLAQWFGTLGSRSRNGWGALHLENENLKPLTRVNLESLEVLRPLEECLHDDWPHAIGKDSKGPLVWKTRPSSDWWGVMKELARIKIAFRTQPDLSLQGVPNGRFSKRHFLAYPVTHHPVNGAKWGGQGRLANQVRFKLAFTSDSELQGVIVHVPCALPSEMAADIRHENGRMKQLETWHSVHTVLDNQARRLD